MINKVAVFGVFRNEKVMFPVWYKYYSEIFGKENIYCFDDYSTDGTFINKPLNYKLLDIEKDSHFQRLGATDYSRLWNFIVDKYHELLSKYRWVLHVDADDFVVANPKKYKNLKDFITKNDTYEYFRCKAFEVMQLENEQDIDWNRKIMCQRTHWIRISNLDKTALTRKSLDLGKGWIIGNHYCYGKPKEKPNPDLLLIHLHRIDYPVYKKKYLIIDNTIQNEQNFIRKYGGYPLFWCEKDLNTHFKCINANYRFGAAHAELEKIPEIYKGVF